MRRKQPTKPVTRDDVRFITPREAAELLGVTVGCLSNWRYVGTGPKYYKVPGIRYKLVDIKAWQDRTAVIPAGA